MEMSDKEKKQEWGHGRAQSKPEMGREISGGKQGERGAERTNDGG